MELTPTVSIVVPAHNAAATLGETLDSVLAQTGERWDAIVVDDGSTDRTAAVARKYAKRDGRIRVQKQAHAGVSAARNAGAAATRGEWLLFLDADDWIAPNAVERYLAAAAAPPAPDLVSAAWVRVTLDGTVVADDLRPDLSAVFPAAARFCPFASPHSCLVRRAPFESLGGFDTSLVVGEDWDLWQRLARVGARIRRVDEQLAFYRMRPGSAGMDVPKLFEAGIRLITLGHSPDPRVARPDPRYARGVDRTGLAAARLAFVSWPAAMLLATGGDARPLLAALGDVRDPELDARGVAHSIFRAALLPLGQAPHGWAELWPRVEDRVDDYLRELERVSGAAALAARARRELEWQVVLHAPPGPHGHAIRAGRTHRATVDVGQPLRDIVVPADVERLACTALVAGEPLGALELAVCDGRVPASVLADALADRFAWAVLGRFFEATVYASSLAFEPAPDGTVTVRRGGVRLAAGLPAVESERRRVLHDRVGWTVFLQELWGEPERRADWFYSADEVPGDDVVPHDRVGAPFLEAASPVVALPAPAGESTVTVELRVGGVPVALVDVPAERGVATASRARAACTVTGGYELCRAAVREGLLGTSLADRTPLRDRLAAAAVRAAAIKPTATDPGVDCAPGWGAALARVSERGDLLLARRPGPTGTTASRRAVLPAAAAGSLRAAAAAAAEPVVDTVPGDPPPEPRRVVYVPEALWRPAGGESSAAAPRAAERRKTAPARRRPESAPGFDRHYFEMRFAAGQDERSSASAHEQLKREQILVLLRSDRRHLSRVLELGCGDGALTELLAPHADQLLASDISQVAIDRASERLARHVNVRFARLDFTADRLPVGINAIVCAEALYYAGTPDVLRQTAERIAAALAPRGVLVIAHSNLVADDPASPGFDWDLPFGAKRIGELLAEVPELGLEAELTTPYYRVQRFRRASIGVARAERLLPARVRRLIITPPELRLGAARSHPPEPAVARRFLPTGGAVRRGVAAPTLTHRLPILRYGSVAPVAGAPARGRVPPSTLDAHLRYLAEAGFHGVTLEEWRQAKARWEPLPGRAVILTFDGGFRDFADYAWPLCKRYGFPAVAFLVTDRVGGTGVPDGDGETAPLLSWDDVRRLRDEGVEFGSYTATHSYLTALPPAEVVDEAARSRAALTRALGAPPTVLAYPFGAEDAAVQHLVGACGYTYGVTSRSAPSDLTDSLLSLPRLAVGGRDSMKDFILKLAP